jgi:hypothetical protein
MPWQEDGMADLFHALALAKRFLGRHWLTGTLLCSGFECLVADAKSLDDMKPTLPLIRPVSHLSAHFLPKPDALAALCKTAAMLIAA